MTVSASSLARYLFSGRVLKVLAHLPDLARLYWRLFRDRRVSVLAKALLVSALAYLVWPLDLVPDFIPFVGEVDDVAVVLSGLWLFVRLCPPEVVGEHVRQIADERRR